MRTTLTIDDDLLAVAKTLARDRSVSVGKALCDLARRGLNATGSLRTKPNGSAFPVFAVAQNATRITPEDVRKAEDEI